MTDDIHPADEPTAEELEAIHRLLSDPAMWAEPSAEVEDRVLAAITGAVAGAGSGGASGVGLQPARFEGRHQVSSPAASLAGETADHRPADLGAHRRRRRRGLTLVPLAAAAALVVAALSALAVLTRDSGTELETVALAGTEAAPDASATARIDRRPNGDRILLTVSSLPPAPDGAFYTVWVIKEEPRTRIPAGSFHMRGGGDAEIELWSGVSTEIYSTVSVTLNTELDPTAPGEVVLRGQLSG
jgi:hypothetical protein